MVALRSGTVATPMPSPSHSVCAATIDALVDGGFLPASPDGSPIEVAQSLIRTSSAQQPQEQQGDGGHVGIVTAGVAGTSSAVVVGTILYPAFASTGDAAVGGKRKANVLTSEELAANARDAVRQATKDKYATAEPVFARYCSENRLDPKTAREFCDATGEPNNANLGRFLIFVRDEILAARVCASMLYNDKSQGTAINWCQYQLKMQRKAVGESDIVGFVVNMVPVPDLVAAVKETKKEASLVAGHSLQKELTTHISLVQETAIYSNLLNFSVGVDPLLCLQTNFEMCSGHRVGCRVQVFRNLRAFHIFPGPVRVEIGEEGETPLRIVVKQGKTLKDPYEYLEMIPQRNPAICGIAAYGYCLIWRFTPECGLLENLPSFSDPSKWHEYFYLPACRAVRVSTTDLANQCLSVRPVTYDTEKDAWTKALASVGITDTRMLTHHFRGQMQRECWSITLAQNFKPLPPHTRVMDILDEFFAQWAFQLEEGKTAGKEHYQGRAIISEAQMTETLLVIFELRGFDRRDVTVLPESNNSIQQGGLSFYVIKDDTRKAGPWYDPSFKPKRRNTYEGRDLRCMDEPYKWQKKIMDVINEEADDRTINWVFNASGCAGKSKLMKYLRWTNPEMARVGLGSATQIKTAVIEKGAHKIYMVDLPRVRGSDERQQELFSALEEIKNGWVESPMYGKAAELLMEPPHIWIFSNELPNISMCSLDRWHVWHLYNKPVFGVQFDRLDVDEVIDMVAKQREAEKKKQDKRKDD